MVVLNKRIVALLSALLSFVGSYGKFLADGPPGAKRRRIAPEIPSLPRQLINVDDATGQLSLDSAASAILDSVPSGP